MCNADIDVLQFREGREFRLELQADQSGHAGDKNNMFAMEDKNSKQVNRERIFFYFSTQSSTRPTTTKNC